MPRQTYLVREKKLMVMSEAWKSLIDGGARVERMGRDYFRFLPILRELVQLPPVKLDVRKQEIVDGGCAVDHAAARLSLLDLRAEHNAKLARVKDGLKKELEVEQSWAAAARKGLKTALQEDYENELSRQRHENEALAARLRELIKKHQRERRVLHRRLEESRQKERESREKREKEAKKVKWTRTKSTLEAAGHVLLEASAIQAQRVEDGIDQIRAIYHSDLPLASLRGMSLDGIGVYAEGVRGGKDLGIYSVTRTGLNKWCDACRYPIGAKVRYREYSPLSFRPRSP